MRAIGIILAGGNNRKMRELSQKRAIGAMPVAGSYRSIDFALSNMTNSHIQRVGVLTQYNARSLNAHLSSSKWWDFGRKQGGLFLFTPAVTAENSSWYRGTADAIYQNLSFLKNSHEPYVVITSGDCVYKMDYNKVLEYHISKKADVTVVCKDMPANVNVERFGTIKMNEEARTFELSGKTYKEGDWISIDGSTGNIYGEQVATVAATGNKNFNRFMGWADAARQLLVMTNADNPRDAQQAVDLGAEGIGLCRTEHMFFAEDRIKAVREMICARTVEEREAALAKVEPFQQGDFEAMYRIMGERPMTIRYLDPPLHEFLPTKDEDIKELAADMGMTFDDLKNVVASLHEFNPMMGHRGCRLAVTYPEIAAMQTRAVIKAALNVSAETGYMITPHIMIPLVGEVKELKFVKDVVVKVADELIAAAGVDMKYQVGTMIEIPRAALTAGEIAKEAEFFSFGTNDLTQMTFGFSRDDAAKFLGAYYENKIYESDPFQHLDQVGVGKLVKMAAHDGRETRPDLGLGICGEHGGDPTSVEFCHNVGLDYVSCSPFRVPIARLAAAQAAIKKPRA